MFALLAASSLAFSAPAAAPRADAARSSGVSMMAKSKSMPFLEAPPQLEGWVGDVGFDPLKVSTYVDMKWMREAELKHGRVAMLATAGFVATDAGFRVPGEAYAGLSSVAAHDAMVEKGDMLVLFLAASCFEILGGVPKVLQMFGVGGVDTPVVPGAYGFDPLGFSKGKGAERMELAEIKNGRLAMLAFSGIVTQAVLYDKGFPYF